MFQLPPAGLSWFRTHGPRQLAALGFLLVHVAGIVLALVALREAVRFRLLLQLVMGGHRVLGLLRIPWFVVPALLGAVVVLALVEAGGILRRWRLGELEPDILLRWRALAYAALVCLLLCAFYLSTAVAFSGPFRVKFPVNAWIFAALSYGGYLVWWLLLPRWRRTVPPGVRRGLDLVGMNAAVVLVLAEISLRVLAAVWPSPLLVTESSASQMRRASGRRAAGTILFDFPVNRNSHYDSEFLPRSAARGTVVVSIGDSFSYGVVPHAYHFTTVAERQSPGVQIYNMGYPGLGPADYLYLLQHEALPLQPDLVVVQLFVGNDVADGGAPAGPARWYDADSYLVAVVWNRLKMMRRAKRVDLAEAAGRSHLTLAELAARYPQLTDPAREPAGMGREVFLQLELRNAVETCAAPEATFLRFFRALAAMHQVAGDVPVAFVVIPDEFQVEDDLWEEVVRRSAQPLERDRPVREVVGWLHAMGWPVLDLLPLLRAAEPLPDGRRHVYHKQDTHFNARGNDIAGRALARFVDSLLSPEAARQRADAAQRAALPPPQRADSLPPAPVSLPLHVDIGDSSARRFMRAGWHADEAGGGQTYAWSDGERSVLAVPLPRGGDIRMDFQVLPFTYRRSPPQRVTIVLDGTEIAAVPLAPELDWYTAVLPAAARRGPVSTLEFRYDWSRSPQQAGGSADIRTLAVAWYAIDFMAVRP